MVVVLLTLIIRVLGSSVNSVIYNNKQAANTMTPMGDAGYGYGMMEESMTAGSIAQDLSIRNVVSDPYSNGYSTGDDGEAYEITDYRATVETRHLTRDCQAVAAMKAAPEVIFESANEGERSCNYSFKVANSAVEQVLAVINRLDPEELSESTYTIKNVIEDYTNELEVLEKKRDSIEQTLNDAINSYDEIARVATSARDAESLSRIIDSKIRIIERLTQEKININTQIDRLARTKAEQLDRLEYTYFYVSIYENKFIDGEQIKNSWKREIKGFVIEVNEIIQDVSVNLLTLLLRLAQWILYLLIVLVIAKYAWKFGHKYWKQ